MELQTLLFSLLAAFLANVAADPFQRIKNGYHADIADFPFMVSLTRTNCGGTLLGRSCVLTAAHCLRSEPKEVYGVVGHNRLAHKRNIVRSSAHPQFEMKTVDCDVAVLKLDGEFAKHEVETMDPDFNDAPVNALVTVAGWGFTANASDADSNILRAFNSTILSNEECSNSDDRITENMFCIKVVNGTDACVGDSGGPVLRNGKQIGVVSFGPDCTSNPKNVPGVYTRLASREVRKFVAEQFIELKCEGLK